MCSGGDNLSLPVVFIAPPIAEVWRQDGNTCPPVLQVHTWATQCVVEKYDPLLRMQRSKFRARWSGTHLHCDRSSRYGLKLPIEPALAANDQKKMDVWRILLLKRLHQSSMLCPAVVPTCVVLLMCWHFYGIATATWIECMSTSSYNHGLLTVTPGYGMPKQLSTSGLYAQHSQWSRNLPPLL